MQRLIFSSKAMILSSKRFYSSSSLPEIVTFDHIQKISQSPPSPNTILVDVRTQDEFNAGSIPNSINIPLDDFSNALALSESNPNAFKTKYGINPLSKDSSHLVLSCRSGRRSATAFTIAQQIGYKKLSNYPGSYIEWSSKQT